MFTIVTILWYGKILKCSVEKASGLNGSGKMHSLHIEQTNNAVVNEDNGIVVPDVYKPLINNRKLANFRYK